MNRDAAPAGDAAVARDAIANQAVASQEAGGSPGAGVFLAVGGGHGPTLVVFMVSLVLKLLLLGCHRRLLARPLRFFTWQLSMV
jgi:hypothetical protein